MSKRKLLVLPLIVVVLVSVFGLSVMAAGNSSPEPTGFKIVDKNGSGTNVSKKFKGTNATKIDLTKAEGLQTEINKHNSKLKVADFTKNHVASYDIKPIDSNDMGTSPWEVTLLHTVKSGYVGIIAHEKSNGKIEYSVFDGKGGYGSIKGVTEYSTFSLYVATAKSSAKTGDYAPAYIAMISVALISCGAIFAIKAKKESK